MFTPRPCDVRVNSVVRIPELFQLPQFFRFFFFSILLCDSLRLFCYVRIYKANKKPIPHAHSAKNTSIAAAYCVVFYFIFTAANCVIYFGKIEKIIHVNVTIHRNKLTTKMCTILLLCPHAAQEISILYYKYRWCRRELTK